jgi:hypothetical protein
LDARTRKLQEWPTPKKALRFNSVVACHGYNVLAPRDDVIGVYGRCLLPGYRHLSATHESNADLSHKSATITPLTQVIDIPVLEIVA